MLQEACVGCPKRKDEVEENSEQQSRLSFKITAMQGRLRGDSTVGSQVKTIRKIT